MNIIGITGRLTHDPELKKTQSGLSVCQVDVAVSRPRTKDKTDFLKVIVWRQSADYLCQYGRKGSEIAVAGSLQSRSYEDKNGNKRTAYEIVADTVHLCGNKTSSSEPVLYASENQDYEQINDGDDDLPF